MLNGYFIKKILVYEISTIHCKYAISLPKIFSQNKTVQLIPGLACSLFLVFSTISIYHATTLE